MARQSMTVRVDAELREQLDDIAIALDRDRSYLVNEALENFVELHKWHLRHIRKGLAEANRGEFVPERQAQKVIERLRRK